MKVNLPHIRLNKQTIRASSPPVITLFVLLAVIVAITNFHTLPTFAGTGGSSCDTALEIPLNDTYTGFVTSSTDDWFKVYISSPGYISVGVFNNQFSSTDLTLHIFEHGCIAADWMGGWYCPSGYSGWPIQEGDLRVTPGYYYVGFSATGSCSDNCWFSFRVAWDSGFIVSSTTAWQDTGLEVQAGDTVQITATGYIQFDSGGHIADPDGQPDGNLGIGSMSSLVPGAPQHTLVGRIGSSGSLTDLSGFLVGSDYSETAFESGRLFLGFNDGFVKPDRTGLDSGGVGDNSGSFTAQITITGCGNMGVSPTSWSPTIICGDSDSLTVTVSASGGLVKDLTVSKVSGPIWLSVSRTNLGDISSSSSETFAIMASPPLGISGEFYYVVRVSNTCGNPSSRDVTGTITVNPQTYSPQVTTDAASEIGTTAATLNGDLDSTGGLDCQVWFEYGASTPYGSSTTKETRSSTGSFSAALSSLSPGTTYHFRACASNSKGTDYGSDRTFTTETATYPPEVTTNAASGVTNSTATLTGDLDSTGDLDCQVWFEYGASTSYGSSTTKEARSSTGSFSAALSGLSMGTTYHFRACASNSKGTDYGSDKTFTTAYTTAAFPLYLIYIIGAVSGGLVLIWPVRKWRKLRKREQPEQKVERRTQELLEAEIATAIKETELKLEQSFSGGLAHEVRNALFDGSVEIDDLSGLEVPDISSLDSIIGKLGATIFDLESQGVPHDVIYNTLLPMLQEIDDLSKRLSAALEKYSKATPTVKNSIGRGLVLAEQFLRYSKMQEIERGEEEINVYVVTRKIGEKYEKAFGDSGIRYTIDSPQGEELIVKGDYVQLEQILENPVLNARDALEGKAGEIAISLSKKDDSVNIIVSDTGKGIPEENVKKIFDPFFSTKGSKGTGLGLKFVKRLVEAYGGSISIQSKVGVGTQVYIDLRTKPESRGRLRDWLDRSIRSDGRK